MASFQTVYRNSRSKARTPSGLAATASSAMPDGAVGETARDENLENRDCGERYRWGLRTADQVPGCSYRG
jgi:hypothetical protein